MLNRLKRLLGKDAAPGKRALRHDLDEWMREGYGLHRAGRLDEAIALYRRILEREPAYADALYLLGEAQYGLGRLEEAAGWIERAIAVNDGVSTFHITLGCALEGLARLGEAETAYRRALELDPESAQCRNNLGTVLVKAGRWEEAEGQFRQALELDGDLAQAHYNLGALLRQRGCLEQAVACFRRALDAAADNVDSFLALGQALGHLGKMEEAIQCFRQGLDSAPEDARLHNSLGATYQEARKLDAAIECFRRAAACDPRMAEAYSNLGGALQAKGELARIAEADRPRKETEGSDAPEKSAQIWLDEAEACFRRACEIDPRVAAPYLNLGFLRERCGNFPGALVHYDQAVQLNAGLAEAHLNRALLLLLLGRLEQGWEEYEWRWRIKEREALHPALSQPEWDGSFLGGKSILIYTEQGYGDAIQFIRYVPQVVEKGGRVVLWCYPEMKRLFAEVGGVTRIATTDNPPPDCDTHCALLSLPRVFGTTLDTIPAPVPYITVAEEWVGHWKDRIGADGRAKIGLVWASQPKNYIAPYKSLSLSAFYPLSNVRDAVFYSLQMGEAGRQAICPPDGLEIIDLTGHIKDFADTTGFIANLDLVISVDTAVAHLAGVMGKPVWTLLPHPPDWRWLLGREDSPWYPTMRLFRQARPGEWGPVLERVASELSAWTREQAAGAKVQG